ncbi:dnaJ homolog subfamily C member 25 homolog [Oratosquilla oratoria]|uniref:dnaJ homolog subfamily C member 25 homolog n=1 Tax=Oratosquilla oratoria TaxID=337810 RepID=UPI003F775066
MMWRVALIISVTCLVQPSQGYVEDYYCGEHNCYDLLEITREATKNDVKRAFRQIASKTHPDRFQDEEEKKIAEERFRQLSTAYDILRDPEARADYDYMLDHPDQFYQNMYRAWRRRMAPHVDVRIVLAVTISLISLVQYYNGWTKYEEAIKYFTTVPKYRLRAIDIAKSEGLLSDKKKNRGMSKEQVKEHEEKIIRQVIENKMDIRGVYAKPTYKDILWVQLLFVPVWFVQYIMWYITWIWRFWIKKEEYGTEEKLYIIRKKMGMSQGQFDMLDDETKQEYLEEELWFSDNYTVWKAQKDEELKVKLAQSGRYKSYRRYMKANGPGRMYFDDS